MNIRKFYSILNLLVIIALIAWNYAANAIGIGGNSIGSLSREYYNLFTPAGYAFSIWGPIFFFLVALSVYQLRKAFSRGGDIGFIDRMGPWLIIANLANGLWVFFWLKEFTGISVIMMLTILVSLVILILRLKLGKESSSMHFRIWVEWPLELYTGWIVVATIANFAAWLSKIHFSLFFSDETWTLIMILIAAALNGYVVLTRRMRVFAFVGVWALTAISVRHWGEIAVLQWAALVASVVVFVVAVLRK